MKNARVVRVNNKIYVIHVIDCLRCFMQIYSESNDSWESGPEFMCFHTSMQLVVAQNRFIYSFGRGSLENTPDYDKWIPQM